MVTHVHPSGTLMEKFTDFFPGSSGVRKAIEKFQPDIALCSHVHEAEGIEEKIGKTKVINVGRKGKIIEIYEGTSEIQQLAIARQIEREFGLSSNLIERIKKASKRLIFNVYIK